VAKASAIDAVPAIARSNPECHKVAATVAA
jgi:hypothetical protein